MARNSGNTNVVTALVIPVVVFAIVIPISALITQLVINYSFNANMTFLQALAFTAYLSLWLTGTRSASK